MNEIQNIKIKSGMENLYASVREILVNARKRAYSAVNFGDTLRPELTWSHYR